SGSPRLNLAELGRLDFQEPDLQRFPMLRLAFEVLKQPDTQAPVFNAANEVAVDLFLSEQIAYMDIVKLTETCLEKFGGSGVQSLEDAFALDEEVRVFARQSAKSFNHGI
ncbi:MAG TPA: 1-deoxy-D-xylulose-5-phosphate reductoisomerase, partial [Limnobacter sp.]|nr:1-deoxy-D-xylulose-5-phosphate reductoisomerase [Limnobacter sp.]